jgi:excinuclease ABC subunit B
MAEDLTDYYEDLGLRVRYMHSGISTLERMDIIRDLRAGDFDVLIGINLLREGLDIPEVSLVAILDADKEGFLRSVRSLVQTCGRASRNVRGRVIMYAGRITASMQKAIDETERRRKIQKAYNTKHNITPASIHKVVASAFGFKDKADDINALKVAEKVAPFGNIAQLNAKDGKNPEALIKKLEKEMHIAARDLEFERAADLRDKIKALNKIVAFGS